MTEDLTLLAKLAIYTLPILLLLWLDAKCNLKKKHRSKQFPMPLIALVLSAAAWIYMEDIHELLMDLIEGIPDWLAELSRGSSGSTATVLYRLRLWASDFLAELDLEYWIFAVTNVALLLAFVVIKRLLTWLMLLFKPGSDLYDRAVSLFYAEHNGVYYVKPRLSQARQVVRSAYTAAVSFSLVIFCAAAMMFDKGALEAPFYPVFGIVILGEVFFFLDGMTQSEEGTTLEGEADENSRIVDYRKLIAYLKKLFGDKLSADDSQTNYGITSAATNDELLTKMEESGVPYEAAYAAFMRSAARSGFELDQNFLVSGLELLRGKSVLFHDPFYADMIPYAFYALNRTLVRSKRVLIVLGRHGTEEEVIGWCRDGIQRLTGVPTMWKVGVLGQTEPGFVPDIGILTRSEVNDIQLHAANGEFFDEVGFVVILEPSRLVTTAQIGLNSIVKRCNRKPGKELVFCAADKNCDGLVDALSHILMTRITQVNPSRHFSGISSYMCWDATGDHLLHRMIPNVARYLGMGTELAFAALRNHVSKTAWYGGEAFPVTDMRWISSQYYHELLGFANLPENQHTFDESFVTSPNPWNPARSKNVCLIVEDESHNMFEVMRNFATRASEQSFVNIISAEYLLKDYMADNAGIFRTDPKAIPYIVADYARTRRNVVLRLLLLMSTDAVSHQDLTKELMLVGINEPDPLAAFWRELCRNCNPGGAVIRNSRGEELISRFVRGAQRTYDIGVIQSGRKYNFDTGVMDLLYTIRQEYFIQSFAADLQNAGYMAEDEQGGRYFLGAELRGHVFQKYLPGQFFTLGGRYYEMQDVTGDGHVLIRRAADHIHTRQWYRQVRKYRLENITDCADVGAQRDISGMGITRQYADIFVNTPGYWRMETFNDFEKGKLVALNGIPQRTYFRKSILRLRLPNAAPDVLRTVTLLLNEVFVTLFAENQPYITALTSLSGDCRQMPCSLDGADPQSIYIVEDSVLDLGLLVAVERNLERILSTACDYLDWHERALDESLNPPPPPPAPQPIQRQPISEEEAAAAPGRQGFFGRIAAFLRRLLRKIRDFFRKLFGNKPQEPAVEQPVAQTAPEAAPVEQEAQYTPDIEPSVEEAPSEALQSFSRRILRSQEPEPAAGTAGDSLEFESDLVFSRLPYHKRYYLLYGGEAVPGGIVPQETLEYLRQLGFGNGALKQARDNRETAERIASLFTPGRQGVRYCDFCGAEITGTEFEILKDGRERCGICSRTAVKDEADFVKIYRSVISDLEAFFGAHIDVPIDVHMVNSKTLHRKLGQSFVPTGNFDGRVLGVAIYEKRQKKYSIYLENGAPRMMAAMTMAHELTHIWQYTHWNESAIAAAYGPENSLLIYEGMAKWAEIQYAALAGEPSTAKREEICTLHRQDEYGKGFALYLAQYPLRCHGRPSDTPFDRNLPLQ